MKELPVFPIVLCWDDIDRSYQSISDIGIDLEYLTVRDQLEIEPRFTDSLGRRFRFVIDWLEVLFCHEVPEDFSHRSMRVTKYLDGFRTIFAETLGEEIHRTITISNGVSEASPQVWSSASPVLPESVVCEGLSDIVEFDNKWRQLRVDSI